MQNKKSEIPIYSCIHKHKKKKKKFRFCILKNINFNNRTHAAKMKLNGFRSLINGYNQSSILL